MKKALVLSSGGIDSTTCLAIAIDELGAKNVSSVSIYYGQRHTKELHQAQKIADYYNIPNYQIDLSAIMGYNKDCSLLSKNDIEIDHSSYSEQIEKARDGMVNTYVPFRNGLMLASVASVALSIYPGDEVDIYIGAHADDVAGAAYADCTSEFTDAMGRAINLGTYCKVSLKAPLIKLNKSQVLKRGLDLRVPYHLTWSCYVGDIRPCGSCGTCIDRLKAFRDNGIIDPLIYKTRENSI